MSWEIDPEGFSNKFSTVVMLNWLLIIYVWTYFSTFCQELGHFIFAKLAGVSPYLVKVGVGSKPLKIRFFDTIFEFRIIPHGGRTYLYYLTLNDFKARFIFSLIGGVFANFTLLIVLVNIFNSTGERLILIPICIEVLLLLSTLLPGELKSKKGEKNIPNDGQQILLAVNTGYSQVFEDFFEAYKKRLSKHESDEIKLPATFFGNDIKTLLIFMEAQNTLQSHGFEEALASHLKVLNYKYISNLEKANILDQLAFIVAIFGYNKYLNVDKIYRFNEVSGSS